MANDAAADADAQKSCSASSAPGDTTKPCPLKKVIELRWDKADAWCSESVSISGKTENYPEGEMLKIAVEGRGDAAAITSLDAQISGNVFGSPWEVKDVLPVGGPSWKDVRELDGKAADKKTEKPLLVHIIPHVTSGTKTHTTEYDRTDPGTTTSHKVGVECRFELEVANYLLTIHGALKYVRGIGKERLLHVEQQLDKIRQLLPSMTVVSNTADPQGGLVARTSIYEWGEPRRRVRQKQRYIHLPDPDRVVTLTATSLTETFPETEALFDAVFHSFRPTSPAGGALRP